MKVRVGVFHTFLYSVEDIKAEFKKQFPQVELINIIEDSMAQEILETMDPRPSLIARMADYYRHFRELGCRCVVTQCTSVGDAIDIAKQLVEIPVLHIDYPMAKQAVKTGKRVGVAATAASTLKPSLHVFARAAKEMNSSAQIKMFYCEGARDALFTDPGLHDKIVIETAEKAALECDVLALAQLSMMRLLPQLQHIKIPILTSLEGGVAQVAEYL